MAHCTYNNSNKYLQVKVSTHIFFDKHDHVQEVKSNHVALLSFSRRQLDWLPEDVYQDYDSITWQNDIYEDEGQMWAVSKGYRAGKQWSLYVRSDDIEIIEYADLM